MTPGAAGSRFRRRDEILTTIGCDQIAEIDRATIFLARDLTHAPQACS